MRFLCPGVVYARTGKSIGEAIARRGLGLDFQFSSHDSRASSVAKRGATGRSTGTRPHSDVIARLEIDDFKSLKNVDVDLGQVNVLIGPNGAGKSNLLEALGILGAATSGRIDDQALLRRGVRPGVPEPRRMRS